jgi:hypothetical protein
MDDRVQPRRASARRSQNSFGEALSEDLTPAEDSIAPEAASDHKKLYDPPRERQIGYASSITAVDASGNRSARWTHTNTSGRTNPNNGLIILVVRTFNNKPTRHQTGAVECLLHGVDSPPIKAPDILRTASKVSQSQICSPIDNPSIAQLERAAGFRREDTDEQRLEKLEAILAQGTNDLREAVPLQLGTAISR